MLCSAGVSLLCPPPLSAPTLFLPSHPLPTFRLFRPPQPCKRVCCRQTKSHQPRRPPPPTARTRRSSTVKIPDVPFTSTTPRSPLPFGTVYVSSVAFLFFFFFLHHHANRGETKRVCFLLWHSPSLIPLAHPLAHPPPPRLFNSNMTIRNGFPPGMFAAGGAITTDAAGANLRLEDVTRTPT